MIQKMLSPWEGQQQVAPKMFHLNDFMLPQWGSFGGAPYCIDWEPDGTNYGLFAFDCNVGKQMFFTQEAPSLATTIVEEYQKEWGADCVMPASMLYQQLCSKQAWREERGGMFHDAKKNGEYPLGEQVQGPQQPGGRPPLYLGREDMRAGARLFVVMIATLEMVLKDISADVAVRRGHRGDFASALKLLEQVVLPKHFGLLFDRPLFDDYQAVQPALSWEAFQE